MTATVQVWDTYQIIRCRTCGRKNDARSMHCGYCGFPLYDNAYYEVKTDSTQ